MTNIPQWIRAELFENFVKEEFPDFHKISAFKVHSALAPGENYASNMLKVQLDIEMIDGSADKLTFMLKVPNKYEIMQEQWEAWGLFERESQMYNQIVPQFENLYKFYGKDLKFGAKFYCLPVSDKHIMLEDLTRRGFKSLKRQDGLDMEHCKSVLKRMAQWHAASAACIQLKDELTKMRGVLNVRAKDLLHQMFVDAMKGLLKATKQLPGHQEYFDKLNKLSSNILDKVYLNCQWDESEFNVLNHGDCWSNNIMFQYDGESRLQATYFVDLQVPLYGSPAMDLYYFILSSSKLDLKIAHFDEMIKYYHENLIENLVLLKYEKDLPSLRHIHQMLIKYGIWGIFTVSTIMAAALCEPTELANLDLLMGESEDSEKFKDHMFLNEIYLKHLKLIIPWLNSRGGLDY
ncbi:uncharacterized protein LOC106087286 [Stomoxys calcitrans]|uniref:uncharacterized protein LOC106087286 n=1 Tax=Stomoxys calcitrans TaxID=35570 RepID=UPI0027E221B3|nr:uncharacterized protein LOC106087286 [Stomoxys calcitrans]